MLLLRRADADIQMAQYAISPEWNPSNDECMVDMAAFHVQQAIEKALKYLLQTEAGVDEETKGYKTLDITFLIKWTEEVTAFTVPEKLKIMADTITEWESASQYGGSYASMVADIKKAITLYHELREKIVEYEAASPTSPTA